jgi:hypothetical protein
MVPGLLPNVDSVNSGTIVKNVALVASEKFVKKKQEDNGTRMTRANRITGILPC